MDVLILGATGNVGGEAFRALVDDASVRPIAGARSADAAREKLGPTAEIRTLDLNDPDMLTAALEGIDAALLLTGYSVEMFRQSKRFLDAACEASVRHIVHIGASGAATNEVGHWGLHHFVEAYIEKLGFSWTHLRPEAFMSNVTAPGFGWLSGGTLTNLIGEADWTWVDAADVGAVAAACLADPDRYAGQTNPVAADSATLRQVAEMLAESLGHDVALQPTDPRQFEQMAIEHGAEPAYIDCVASQFEMDAAGVLPKVPPNVDQLTAILGRAPIRWTDHIARVRDSLD